MTPTLQKIVEAMAAEFLRQDREERLALSEGVVVRGVEISLVGDYDLEKVARAGLEAARPADPLDAPDIMVKGSLQQYALREALDAILGEKP